MSQKNKSIKKSINKERENDKLIDKKEYELLYNNTEYTLKVEIDNKYIIFSVNELNAIFNYIFKGKYELSQIVKQLHLVQLKYTSLSKLLKFIDKAYANNKISIEQKSDDELSLIFEVPVDFEIEKFSLNLQKKYLDDKQILTILIDQINRLNNNNVIVKNKFNEIEKQINRISSKNSGNICSEGSDINEEINIIKQQLSDINNKLNGNIAMNDKNKTRNHNNSVNNNLVKSTNLKKSNNNEIINPNNMYKSQTVKKNDIKEEKEEDEKIYYNDNDNDNDNNKSKKHFYNNERYYNNRENGINKNDEKRDIVLKSNNKKTIKRQSNEKNKHNDRDNEHKENNKNLKRSKKESSELKKSKKYQNNEDIKEEEEKYENNKPNLNEKYYIINNSSYNDKDNATNNESLNRNNIGKKHANNTPKRNNDNKKNTKKHKGNQSSPNNALKESINNINNNTNNKEQNANPKRSNQLEDNKVDKFENIKNYPNKINYIQKNQNQMEEYLEKINNNYESCPIKLHYKMDICKTNTSCGWNDMFEIFISYQDNKEYLASPDNNNYNINIISLSKNKVISELKGHTNRIRTIRYFIKEFNNDKDNENKMINEYLISADDNRIVIVWDIINNYEIRQKIDTNYEDDIYSVLIFFDNDITNNQNYIITSTYSSSNDIQNSATKIYTLDNGEFINYINESNYDNIYYLLLWYNKKDNNNYLIQFSYKKILINKLDIKNNDIYAKLSQEPENEHYSGFIYSKDDNEYLCTSCYNGFIHIWDLYNKKNISIIDTKSLLCHIIQWNEKYVIAASYENKSFIIVDLDEKKVYNDIKVEHTLEVKCVKKMIHPDFGECLLTAGRDNVIKLWKL